MGQSTPGFNGKRLRQARDVCGLTITALAEMIDISKQAISQFEKGAHDGKACVTPRPEILTKIAAHLNFPKDFFLQESHIVNDTPIHYRSLSAATKTARVKAESKLMWLQEISGFLKQYVELPTINIPFFNVSDCSKLSSNDIETFATETRHFWGLGDRPILNVLNLMESNGAIVSRIDLEAETLDALSQWADYDGGPYVILSSNKDSAARSRFDISHELAHLTFHRQLSKNICYNPIEHSIFEKQAHRFAGAFLLPALSFMNDLVIPTLDCFWALKEKWQTSIAAMIMRCQHLGIIDDEGATKLWINYNRRGWKRREPLDDKLPIEQPRLLRRSLELLFKENILTKEDVAYKLPYRQASLEEMINLPSGFLSLGKNVEYFPSIKAIKKVTDNLSIPVDSKIVDFPKRER